ncbi:MAG: hypothetical protein AAF573_03530 [Bacteroidota bacterium]
MRDRLEDFINEHRKDFDQKVPNLKVWSDIEKRLDPPKAKRISMNKIIGVAAAVIFLLAVGTFVGTQINVGNTTPVAAVQGIDESIYPNYAEQEKNLKKRINQKRAQLASYTYDDSVNEDLSDLDQTLSELRTELRNVPKGSEEQIVQAMIKNYETKIKILEIVLEKINSTHPKRDAQDEGSEM